MSDEIDARKIGLDERRLDFEIRKYDEDKPLRELALQKAHEDLSKVKGDVAKVKEDIRLAQRPFYGNPMYLTPLATICVALLGGFFAFKLVK